MVQKKLLVAGCLAGLAGSASAGLIDVTITGALNPANTSLDCGSPAHWTRGTTGWGSGDWGSNVVSSTVGDSWAHEKWIGMAPVSLNVNVTSDGDPDVKITKMLQNTTGSAWTSFTIDLFKFSGFGPITVLGGTEASDRFSTVTTTNFGSGDAQMIFTQSGTDTPVLPGESVMFQFTFNVPGAVAFAMVQTPVPAPGAIALLGVAGAMVNRRRR